MALSGYYDVSRYAAASLVFYGVASVAARRGCVRGDGAVKKALVYVAAVMLQRAFWATVPSPDPTPFSLPFPSASISMEGP